MSRAERVARLQAMVTLGLLEEQEVRLLVALRDGDAATLSAMVTECLAAAVAKEGGRSAPRRGRVKRAAGAA